MCIQFEQAADRKTIVERFHLVLPTEMPDRDEFRPTNEALIIDTGTETPGSPRSRLLAWGIPAPWDGKPLVNARSETLTEKKTFSPLLENRCLVPATAYFEWRKDGRLRFKNRITPRNNGIVAFAGLYSEHTFTVITCNPAAEIAAVHNRMPVILEEDTEKLWLDRSRPFAEVADLLSPYGNNRLTAVEETPPKPKQPDLFS
ncbi:MAG: SOS response-associated peptidase [Rhodospirillales bacterium]|nr:SOS response-associated peptidase [Rhodospirillales bacterium]